LAEETVIQKEKEARGSKLKIIKAYLVGLKSARKGQNKVAEKTLKITKVERRAVSLK
jgi:hypothetical protein